MQTLYFPFFFFTTPVFASQSGYFTSRIESALSSLSTSSLTTRALSGPSFRLFCFTGLKLGSTLSWWDVTSILIPGISSVDQEKVDLFRFKKQISSRLIPPLSLVLIPTHLEGLEPSSCTWIVNSVLGASRESGSSSVETLSADSTFNNCYCSSLLALQQCLWLVR